MNKKNRSILCIVTIIAMSAFMMPVSVSAQSSYTINPLTATIEEGNTTTLSVAGATADLGEVTFSWWSCSSDGTVSGSTLGTGDSYTTPSNLSAGTYYYKWTTIKDTVDIASDIAAVTVTAPAATVDSVTVSPETASVQTGGQQQFTATVSGTNNPPQDVTWAITGNNSNSTSISQSGLLTIAADETAGSITVTATSTVNDAIYGSLTVTIQSSQPISITVPEAAASLIYNGQEQTGIPDGSGYTVAGGKATKAGEYSATLTLAGGCIWSDNTTEDKKVNWSIAKKEIVLELTGSSVFTKVYDGTRAVNRPLAIADYTLDGVVDCDDVRVADLAVGVYSDKNAGDNKTVTFSGVTLTGKDAGNYSIQSSTVIGSVGQITKKAITCSLKDSITKFTKVYDGTMAVNQSLARADYTLDGVVGGDDVSAAAGSGVYNDKNAGDNKTVTFSGVTLTGKDAGNYSIQSSTMSGSVGQITRKTISGSLTAGHSFDKVYDGTTTAALGKGYTLNGVVAGDTVPLTAANGFYDSSAIGDRTVTFSGFSINDGNYLLSMADSLSGKGKITSGSQDRNYSDALTGFFEANSSDGHTVFSGTPEDHILRIQMHAAPETGISVRFNAAASEVTSVAISGVTAAGIVLPEQSIKWKWDGTEGDFSKVQAKIFTGSTIVVLQKDYLNTLPAGTYTLHVEWGSSLKGEATFMVVEPSADDNEAPDTGDRSTSAAGWGTAWMISLGIIAVCLRRKRQMNRI